MKLNRILSAALLLVVITIILGLTLQSPTGTIELSESVRDKVIECFAALGFSNAPNWWCFQPGNFRTLAHIPEYFFLGLAAMIAVGRLEPINSRATSQSMRSGSTPVHKDPVGSSPMLSKLKPWQLAILICLAVSVLDQITKGILPTREINPIEWVLDAIGYVCGVVVVGLIQIRHYH